MLLEHSVQIVGAPNNSIYCVSCTIQIRMLSMGIFPLSFAVCGIMSFTIHCDY